MTVIPVLAAASLLRLAIYYGYPTLVEQSGGNVRDAARVLGAYDVLVLGDGLELPPDARASGLDDERRKLPDLISLLHATRRRTEVFGYIDLGRSQNLSLEEIARRIELWQRVGADGIFFDEAGTDFGVSRDTRNDAIEAVHRRRLSVFLNVFDPDDAFNGAADAQPDAQLGAGDAVLLESFAVRNGVLEPREATATRVAAAQLHRRAGVRMLGVTTTLGEYDAALFAEAHSRAVELQLDGFGWGEPTFSAADSRLPWRRED